MKSLLLILIGSFFLITPPTIGKNTPTEKPGNSDGKSLIHYVNAIQGLWQEIGFIDQAGFNLKIDPSNISDSTVKISVSDYYFPGMVEYLHFAYRNQRLEYTGASREDNFFDLNRIDFIYIWYEVEGRDTTLVYEAREMEYENYVKIRMRRNSISNLPPDFWACGLQQHLSSLIASGNFEIYDRLGNLTNEEHAFGTTALAEELTFFEDNAVLWPMYEETCVRAEFEMVVIGSFNPGGSAEIYGIEWEPDEIRLYETHSVATIDGLFPLVKGELMFTIRPTQITQPLIE
ncbi:MAG: hypothetical protein R3B93_22795 [Bacteroidia bacterium]